MLVEEKGNFGRLCMFTKKKILGREKITKFCLHEFSFHIQAAFYMNIKVQSDAIVLRYRRY